MLIILNMPNYSPAHVLLCKMAENHSSCPSASKRYRSVTSVDYRIEVNCRFVCKCHADDIIVTIAHKPICFKNGDICKYTRNGIQVCSHILYVLLNKVELEEDDGRLNQIAHTTSIQSPCWLNLRPNRRPMY